MIDLRSDTVTRPTEGMLTAMTRADVGDDVYDEDPAVNALQDRVAELFGFEAALFVPTGSLANLLAVRTLIPVGTEVLCESQAHIARAEMGAHARLFGTTTRTWTDPRGRVDLEQVRTLIASDLGPFLVRTAALSVENTHNFGGGTVQPPQAYRDLVALAREYGLGVHVDGARIWNAHVAGGVPLPDLVAGADVLAVCLSKGLGAPVGSLVLGSAAAIADAREWRKRLGGGWRQAGLLAAAGSYALEHHIDRLAEDHANARLLAEACGMDPSTVETNIVVVPVDGAPQVAEVARAEGVLVSAVGPSAMRLVSHLDVSESDAKHAAQVLAPLVAR